MLVFLVGLWLVHSIGCMQIVLYFFVVVIYFYCLFVLVSVSLFYVGSDSELAFISNIIFASISAIANSCTC